jgi:hypothetical protein
MNLTTSTSIKAIEMVGHIDKDRLLQTYRPLPLPEHTQVRVIVLYPEAEELRPLNDEEFKALTTQFRTALVDAGYDSEEKVIELIQEIKQEIAQERYGVNAAN